MIPLNPDQKLVGRNNELQDPFPNDDYLKVLIRDGDVKVPEKFKILDIVNIIKKHNTSLFILRMHIAVMVFAVLIFVFRLYIK